MIFQDIWGCLPTTLFFFYQGSSSKEKAFRTDNQGVAPSQNEVYPQRITMKEWGPIIYLYGSVSKPCTPVVHIKIAGKWMFIPLKMVLIGIDPYPYIQCGPPPVVRWFINPINYSYKYHKP